MDDAAALSLDPDQAAARAAFESLRDRICAAFEAIERDAGSDAAFAYLPTRRTEADGRAGGGGVRGLLRGQVFEKAGVNVSTVAGRLGPELQRTVNGAAEDPRFFATGISLVAHMANPHVPAVHMNLRYLVTTRRWFGGGADLNPALPQAEDTQAFHGALARACEAHPGVGDYSRFKAWADDYFWLPHRKVHRGVGGIFFDNLEVDFSAGLTFAESVGEALLSAFPAIVRRRMDEPAGEADRAAMLAHRGRYAEFNLLYDRGTIFGLKSGHDPDAVLMSLPPLAAWS